MIHHKTAFCLLPLLRIHRRVDGHIGVERNIFLAVRGLHCGIKLSADAKLRKGRKYGFLALVIILNCFEQTDHALLHQIVLITANNKQGSRSFSHNSLISLHQRIHRIVILRLCPLNQDFLRQCFHIFCHFPSSSVIPDNLFLLCQSLTDNLIRQYSHRHGCVQRINIAKHRNAGNKIAILLDETADTITFISNHDPHRSGQIE